MKALLTLTVAGAGLVWGAAALDLPARVLSSRSTVGNATVLPLPDPNPSAAPMGDATVNGPLLRSVATVDRDRGAVSFTSPLPVTYLAPFDGTVERSGGSIVYQSPRLHGAVMFSGGELAAAGAIAAGYTLARGTAVTITRVGPDGQPVPLERSLAEALQVGARQ